jgi:hypothetical protein
VRRLMPGSAGVATIYGLIACVGFVSAIGTLMNGNWILFLLVLLGTIFFAVLAGRAWSGGIYDTGDAVRAQSELSSALVKWEDIERFEYRGMKGLGLWTKNGAWVFLQNASNKDMITSALNVLDEELHRHRSSNS